MWHSKWLHLPNSCSRRGTDPRCSSAVQWIAWNNPGLSEQARKTWVHTPFTCESSLDELGWGSLIVVCSLRQALFKDVAMQTAEFLGGFSLSIQKGPRGPLRCHSHSAGLPVRVSCRLATLALEASSLFLIRNWFQFISHVKPFHSIIHYDTWNMLIRPLQYINWAISMVFFLLGAKPVSESRAAGLSFSKKFSSACNRT